MILLRLYQSLEKYTVREVMPASTMCVSETEQIDLGRRNPKDRKSGGVN